MHEQVLTHNWHMHTRLVYPTPRAFPAQGLTTMIQP